MADKMSVPPSDSNLSPADKTVVEDEKAAQLRDKPGSRAAAVERGRALAAVEVAYLQASAVPEQAAKRAFWQQMKDSVWVDICQ